MRRASGGFFDGLSLRRRAEELGALVGAPGFWAGPEARSLARELGRAEAALGRWDALSVDLDACRSLLASVSAEDGEALADDVERLEQAADELDRLLSPPRPEDRLGAIVEINAGAGGAEATEWCSMLLRMYQRWAASEGRAVEMTDSTQVESGLKSVTLLIGGEGAFGRLRGETGVHRLVRVSPHDAQGRRHTSFASVSVVPDVDDRVEIVLRDGDYERESFCSGGPGGQNVNKVASAVRLTHKATGIAVKCQSERSQLENLRLALKALRGRLYDLELRRRDEAFAARYESGKTAAAFGHRLRTYVLDPYRLVRDARTGHQTSDAFGVLDGGLGPFLDALPARSAVEDLEAP